MVRVIRRRMMSAPGTKYHLCRNCCSLIQYEDKDQIVKKNWRGVIKASIKCPVCLKENNV